ncbi:uncharacterized protein G2W53_028737 [Senna tora]|uniref:Uncharacterized protein n=1 Tax=Senna tora TaxID=362788 RepID=A0A834T3V9_9FABA|nr:uncharacterized protein G2W53_028737 [Senna tora]
MNRNKKKIEEIIPDLSRDIVRVLSTVEFSRYRTRVCSPSQRRRSLSRCQCSLFTAPTFSLNHSHSVEFKGEEISITASSSNKEAELKNEKKVKRVFVYFLYLLILTDVKSRREDETLGGNF